MKTSSIFCISALTTTLLAAPAALAESTRFNPDLPVEGPVIILPAHELLADGVHLSEIEPGALPSPAYPGGTVFATGHDAVNGHSIDFVAEVDVARAHALHRVDVDCGAILRLDEHLYAICGRELVAFTASTLTVDWRIDHGLCPGADPRFPGATDIYPGPDRIGIAYACQGDIVVGVAHVKTQRMLGAVNTHFDTTAFLPMTHQIFFHGPTAIVRFKATRPHGLLAVLSPDYLRIQTRLVTSGSMEIWDDGVHLHAYQDHARSYKPSPDVPEFKGLPRWFKLDRDYTLSDTLQPLGSAPKVKVQMPVLYGPSNVRGEGPLYDVDNGTQHFWLSFSCCGGEPGGVFTASSADSPSP
jgi:hypothetical protein